MGGGGEDRGAKHWCNWVVAAGAAAIRGGTRAHATHREDGDNNATISRTFKWLRWE